MNSRGGALWAVAVAVLGAACGKGDNIKPTDAGLPPLLTEGCFDNDGDGFGGTGQCDSQPQRDCNDNEAAINPGAKEVCDGLDNDCDGVVDNGLNAATYYVDRDGDGFGAEASGQACAVPKGYSSKSGDCSDNDASVHPGAAEVCNQADDDCDGAADNGLPSQAYYPDADGDTYGNASATPRYSCAPVAGFVANKQDCDDTSTLRRPGAAEMCNQVDDDCNGQVDDGVVIQNYFPDLDGDGFGAKNASPQASCALVPGKVANNSDCDDTDSTVRPTATEVCNGKDDNCAGGIDEGLATLTYYPDVDGDGFGAKGAAAQVSCVPLSGKVTNDADCNDANLAVKPGATETCDGTDQNCNGQIDEGLATVPYFPDTDGDGYGDKSAAGVMSCGPVQGKASNNLDCNDTQASIRPGGTELCNNVDDNCNSTVDEGNPGGGAACNTGQSGVCAAGTVTCQGGALTCLRNVAPSGEKCNGLDDNCNNATDEDFPLKNQNCTVGVGVCARTTTWQCNATGTGLVCPTDAGLPTVPACDGLDNDCDGVVDEPHLTDTVAVGSTTAWQAMEVAPFYFSPSSCLGGADAGTDALAGGALALATGTGGLYFQKLDATGVPVDNAVAGATSLNYLEVGLAQAGDAFVVAGVYKPGTSSVGRELDFYLFDAQTGVKRAQLWSQFNTGNALDSLQVVRVGGRRVLVLWREAGVGLRMVRLEPAFDGFAMSWSITGPNGSAVTASNLVASSTLAAGVGADSNIQDWPATQTCLTAADKATVAVAYQTAANSLSYFTMAEDGTAKSSVEVVYSTSTAGVTLAEPDVGFFKNAGVDQYFIGYITKDSTGTPSADLNYWLTNDKTYHFTYFAFATQSGVNSISRPRVSATATRLWLSAHRYVSDVSGFNRQVMTRVFDLTGNKVPTGSGVEISATAGACGTDAACRPGDKYGFTSWAPFGRVYYSASGSMPTGSYASSLSCQ